MALTDNLLAYWKLDESSGNAVDSVGTNTGVNTSVTYAAGKINNGAVFNGSAYLTVARNASIEPVNAISIAMWVNISSTSNFQMLIAKGENAGDTRSWELRCNGTTTQLQMQGRRSDAGFIACATTSSLGTGTWKHIVFTRNGTTMAIYINGVSDTLTGVTSSSLDFAYSTDDLWIGQRNGGLRFNGSLDEIGLWSRALTSTEVTSLYNGGSGLQYPFGASTPTGNMLLMF